jgi:hypothetical protein
VVDRTARQQLYCSADCRKKAPGVPGTRAAENNAPAAFPAKSRDEPLQNANEIKRLQTPILAPRRVIARELFAGRTWAPVISKDGVESLVTQLKPPALLRGPS